MPSMASSCTVAPKGNSATCPIKRPIAPQEVLLYPNPSLGTFALDVPKRALTIEIADAQGRVEERVRGLNPGPSTFRIASAGVYSVMVLSDSGCWVQRVGVE
jgi:hypothetical protein